MIDIFVKLRNFSKKAALFCSLFLAIFIAGFFLVNLDFSSNPKNLPKPKTVLSSNMPEELQKRIGDGTAGFSQFDQWAKANVLTDSSSYDSDPDKDGLPNYLEYIHGTDPNNPDTDNDKFSDKQEILNGYDPDAFGDAKPMVEIEISKINIEAPMVWSKSEKEKEMLAELENGVGHYFKTASPGQNGNMILSGHSSNYVWAKGNYKHIFKDLNNLEKGDVITVNTFQRNGKAIAYSYKVREKFSAFPDDEKIFASSSEPVMTLSTCWPLGTNFKRLIVKADLMR